MKKWYLVLASSILGGSFLVGSNLDAAPPVEIPSVGYPVTNLPAATVAGRIQDLLEASSLKAELVVDRSANRLVVKGNEDAQRVVRQAIGALDVPATNRAADASSLQPVALPPQRLEQISTALQLRYAQDKRIRFAPDRRTNQLLILAPNNLQDGLRAEALAMANPPGAIQPVNGQESSKAATQRFKLQHMGWQEIEDRLIRLSGERPIITTKRNGEVSAFQLTTLRGGDTQVEVDRRSSEVSITAPEPSLGGWRQTLSLIDLPPTSRSSELELVRLEHAEPAPIQQALRLLAQLPNQSPAAAKLPPRGFPMANVALQNINAPDAQPPGNNQPNPQQPAAPGVLGTEAGAGVIGDVQVEFVPELGVLVVRGSKRDVQRVMEVIKQIEAESTVTQPEVAIHVLQHISSNATADLLSEVYDDVFAPRQGQVTIKSLDAPNALLLIGRKEAVVAVKSLLEKIDQPTIPSAELKVFQLQHASAIDAETTVRDFFTNQPGSDDENRPGLGTRVRIIADYRTNALIVQAAPRDLIQVAELLKNIDVDHIPSTQQIHVFKLRNSLAADLATVLTTAITAAEDGDTGRAVPSSKLSILSVDKNGNRVLDSGILTGVVITADSNANALIVRAPAASMALLGELITQLDQIPGGQSMVKVFAVQHGDASGLITMLTQLFALQQTQGTAGGAAGTAGGTGAVGQGIGRTQLTAAPESSVLPLRLAVDRRTNSIIATGSLEDLKVVEALLVRLDTEGLASRITEVIWLRNATSSNVALALQDFVAGQTGQQLRNQNTPGLGQASGIIDLLDRDLIVADEPVTNSLIISVAPRLYDTVRRIIEQLDRRPPMVLIKTILCEVTLTDGFEFGSELGLQDSLLFDRSVVANGTQTPGFNFNNAPLGNSSSAASTATRNQLGTQGLSSFLVGRSSSAFGYGGFVLSAASDSVNILIRALQDAGRVQILSRPQIMTLDNTLGLVLVGSKVPRISGFNSNINGVSQPIVTDTEVGLILRVRPRVGADGLIIMDIDAQRSALGAEADGVAIGFSPNGDVIRSPQILTTQAQSTITAYNGQTVIFGGLITKQRTQASRRIPYISDIPLLGLLFRFDSEIERRTELLAVMTPMLVSSDQDLDYIKATESGRMSYCLADVVEMHGPVGLSPGYGLWGPAVGATIYPDLQPSVDDLPKDACPEPLPMYQQGGSVIEGPVLEGPVSGGSGIDPGLPSSDGTMEVVPRPNGQYEANPPGSAAWKFSTGVQPASFTAQPAAQPMPQSLQQIPKASQPTLSAPQPIPQVPQVGDVISLPDFDIGPSTLPAPPRR